MSKIDELIAKYCPNGVEFKELGEVCEIKTGQQVSKIEIQQNPGKFPVINSGREPLGFINRYNTENDPIGITTRGAGVGSITWCEGKYFRGNLNYSATIKNSKLLDVRFLFHILINSQLSIQKLATFNGIPALNKSNLEKLTIPIPPLPIQQEIVNILDKFTELEEELEKELEEELKARRKQYKYYRNQLLTPVEVDGKWLMNGVEVEWKTLGELGIFYGGLSGKTKADFQDGNAKYISYMNVYSNIAINTNINDFVRIGENENQNRVEYGDVLFTGSSETPDECGISSVLTEKISEPLYLNSFCFGFRLHDKNLFLPDFLKYLFRDDIIRKQIARTANGVTRFNVSKKLFAKILIPIPPLSEQERIVEILDKFDSLVNDISISLPAEIEARRKQYEYYRSKLLSFKPK